jgi:hypothetical protein
MSDGLTPEGVAALAPDAKVAAAGKKLGVTKSWQNLGRSPEVVWGECRKAETRDKMITILETDLLGDDEPFLEQALDDKSKGVRTTAARLHSRLPASAYAARP